MKSFLPKCIGISLVIFSIGFFIRSIQPAYAGKNERENFTTETGTDKVHVMWVNIDSIDANYKAFSDLSKEAGGDLEEKTKEYQKMSLDIELRYSMLQQRERYGTWSAERAQKEEDAINKESDEAAQLEMEINNMQNAAMEKNQVITNDITTFLKEFSQKKNVDYIFRLWFIIECALCKWQI